MPKIPERQLSYGEMIAKLRLAYKKNQERKARYIRSKRRKPLRSVPTEYTPEDVLRRIEQLNNEYKGY